MTQDTSVLNQKFAKKSERNEPKEIAADKRRCTPIKTPLHALRAPGRERCERSTGAVIGVYPRSSAAQIGWRDLFNELTTQDTSETLRLAERDDFSRGAGDNGCNSQSNRSPSLLGVDSPVRRRERTNRTSSRGANPALFRCSSASGTE